MFLKAFSLVTHFETILEAESVPQLSVFISFLLLILWNISEASMHQLLNLLQTDGYFENTHCFLCSLQLFSYGHIDLIYCCHLVEWGTVF